jgi:hypothetical protein
VLGAEVPTAARGRGELGSVVVLSFSFYVVVPGSSLCEVEEGRTETNKRKTQNKNGSLQHLQSAWEQRH